MRVADTLFARRFEALFRHAPALWEPAPLDAAQLVVQTDRYEGGSESEALAALARDSGVPCLFFDTSDDHTPRHPCHGYVYRSAILGNRLTPVERAMPPICEDMLLYHGGQSRPRERADRPVVGFCGYILPRWKALVQRLRGQGEKAVGHSVRASAVQALARSRLVETNFLIRDGFWGGAVRAQKDAALVARVRAEFVDNMFGCDYVLCVRGAGNFSYRLYEALSAGRIPLLVDTDCCLPLSDRIDWSRHCVIVDGSRADEAPRVLAEFHAGLSPERFLALQAANRALWERFLNPLEFLRIAVDEAVHAPVEWAPTVQVRQRVPLIARPGPVRE